MQAHFKQLFEYDKWANHQLLAKFEKQFPQNERIYQLFSHMLSAQRIWLDRCTGLPISAVLWGDRLPDELRIDTETYSAQWLDFIDTLEPPDFNNTVTYTNSKGETYTNKLTDIMMHVINHGTYHRGNLIILMKEEGFVLPNLDYITYVR